MRVTTWQLIKMLWRKEDWYQVYWHGHSDLEQITHKETGLWFYADCSAVCVRRGDIPLDSWSSISQGIIRIFIWFLIISPLASRATRFARNHSYLPPERQTEESWK